MYTASSSSADSTSQTAAGFLVVVYAYYNAVIVTDN